MVPLRNPSSGKHLSRLGCLLLFPGRASYNRCVSANPKKRPPAR
jgi:hypothetical protein